MKEFIVKQPQSLKEFTDNTYAQGSFFCNYLLKNKDIKVNGKKTGENVRVFCGDSVAYYLSTAQEEKPAFYTVYEDENVLVADKDSGVNSEAVFAALSRERGLAESCFLHRLDRNTRGVMIFALQETAAEEIKKAFRERRVEKIYRALCFGKFPKQTDVLTAYLKKDEKKSEVKIFDSPVAGAEKIITEYRVVGFETDMTVAEIVLHTGKTHQIRAHLAHIGCPVAGDTKYGSPKLNAKYNLTRQCLVAKSLSLTGLSEKFSYLEGKIFLSRFDVKN